MKFLVTGGAGFIGSALVRYLINDLNHETLCIDTMSYASKSNSLDKILENPLFQLCKLDICEQEEVKKIIFKFKPEKVIHLAAETHVDRSIDNPEIFLKSNIFGTFSMLEACLSYWRTLDLPTQKEFRFHHISTDEVYGDLDSESKGFSELTSYDPSSPYSASKASSDHLVRSWYRTFGLPTVISNCSNNYGPFQYPEKLIPLMIFNALNGSSLPIYGKGDQIRDWLYVDDHVKAMIKVCLEGGIGQSYNIGGNSEKTNLEVVSGICRILDSIVKPSGKFSKHEDLISFVEDRPGHDKRYAIDASKIKNELGWEPQEDFETGLLKTVQWYVDNRANFDFKENRLGAGK